jgi:hypothetical protein
MKPSFRMLVISKYRLTAQCKSARVYIHEVMYIQIGGALWNSTLMILTGSLNWKRR